jgi:glutaredoxin
MAEIKIVGKIGCSRCEMVKNIFDNKNISYTYQLLDELKEEEKKVLLSKAREKGLMNMPLIIKNDELVDFEEVLN